MNADVFQPDGSEREFDIGPLVEHAGTHISVYIGDCSTIVPGDPIAICEGSRLVGGRTYKPSAVDSGSAKVIPAGYVGDYKENDIVYFLWRTKVAPSVAGTIKVYKNDGTGEVSGTTGITDDRDFDGKSGVHLCRIDLSANSFYAIERDYSVVLTGATIDGQSVNIPIASFSIQNRHQGIDWKRDK